MGNKENICDKPKGKHLIALSFSPKNHHIPYQICYPNEKHLEAGYSIFSMNTSVKQNDNIQDLKKGYFEFTTSPRRFNSQQQYNSSSIQRHLHPFVFNNLTNFYQNPPNQFNLNQSFFLSPSNEYQKCKSTNYRYYSPNIKLYPNNRILFENQIMKDQIEFSNAQSPYFRIRKYTNLNTNNQHSSKYNTINSCKEVNSSNIKIENNSSPFFPKFDIDEENEKTNRSSLLQSSKLSNENKTIKSEMNNAFTSYFFQEDNNKHKKENQQLSDKTLHKTKEDLEINRSDKIGQSSINSLIQNEQKMIDSNYTLNLFERFPELITLKDCSKNNHCSLIPQIKLDNKIIIDKNGISKIDLSKNVEQKFSNIETNSEDNYKNKMNKLFKSFTEQILLPTQNKIQNKSLTNMNGANIINQNAEKTNSFLSLKDPMTQEISNNSSFSNSNKNMKTNVMQVPFISSNKFVKGNQIKNSIR